MTTNLTRQSSHLHLLDALKGAAVGATGGLVLWLVARFGGSLQIGPLAIAGDWVGTLGSAGWLVPLLFAGAVLGGITGIVAEVRHRERTLLMREVAESMSMDYTPDASIDMVTRGPELFHDPASVKHLYRGTRDGGTLEIFDLTEVYESPDSEGGRKRVRRTVCVVPAEGLPDFTLTPRKWFHRFLAHLGFGGISFDPNQLPAPLDRETVRRFAKTWRLDAATVMTAMVGLDPSTGVATVRKLFTPRLMDALPGFRGYSVRSRSGRLVVWRGKGFRAAAGRKQLASTAVQIRRVALESVTAPPTVEIPSAPGETPAEQSRRAAGAIAGGIVGAMVGFFGGFVTFVALFLGRDPGSRDMPFLLLFFALPLVGVAIAVPPGAFLGSRLGRVVNFSVLLFRAPPGASRGWIFAGGFLGFCLGGLLGIGVLAWIFTWEVEPNPLVVFPLFFGFPVFGCAIGLLAGTRFQAHRARRRAA